MSRASKNNWQPTASIASLKQRAAIIKRIRDFFQSREVWEVETPLLSCASIPDPNIPSFALANGLYLQTSPEFAMKRLLAANSGDIFQICKAFRHDEVSKTHNPEFTMLEWYRVGFDHHQLMDEMDALLQTLLNTNKPADRLTYQAVFEKTLAINPHTTSTDELKQCAEQHALSIEGTLTKDEWLDVLFTHLIQDALQDVTFIYDYPASQAALARINNGVAERFEVFAKGHELANGFHELADANEQRSRFENDLSKRETLGLSPLPIDKNLLAALEQGLPDCAGVALGIDRLIMLMLDLKHIKDVLSFNADNA